jgi:hypothetical protein
LQISSVRGKYKQDRSNQMDFRVHLMAQHARAHTAGIGQPDFSNQDLIVRDLTDEHMMARGQVVELRTADLRFSEPEAAQFLNEVMDLRLDSGSVRQIEERTEGWIAGLQMAALLGTTCGVKELEGENLGNAGVSSCVQTVVDWLARSTS